MTKPVISAYPFMQTVDAQPYERYLPTAFDESLTLLEKMNKVIQHMNSVGELSNGVIEQWNSVMEWTMNDGLSDTINNRLSEMLDDGTLDTVINQEILGSVAKGFVVLNADETGITPVGNALQTAVNQASSQNKNVRIPKGVYLIDQTVTLPDNTTIIGDGAVLKAKTLEGSYPTAIFKNASNVVGNKNIVLRGLTLDGNVSTQTTTQTVVGAKQNNLLNLQNVDGVQLIDVNIINVRNNKENASQPPDTFYPAFFKNCKNVMLERVTSKGHINNEGIRFIYCNDLTIKDFVSDNTQVWTPLHIYYCNRVHVENSKIFEEKTNIQASTLNMYSSNVLFKNCVFIGGKGVDIGNEANDSNFTSENVSFENCYFEGVNTIYNTGKTVIRNVSFKKCEFVSEERAFSFYEQNIDNLSISDCKMKGLNGNHVGMNFDTRNGAYVHDVVVKDSIILNYETPIKLYLRYGLGFRNFKIDRCKLVASPLGAKSSIGGASNGVFIQLYDVEAWSGAYCEDVRVTNCTIECEGSPVQSVQSTVGSTVITAKDIFISDNLSLSKGVDMGRGFQIRGFNGVNIKNNVTQKLSPNASNIADNCSNISVSGNKSFYSSVTTGTRPWRIEACSGFLSAGENVTQPTNLTPNHFSSVNGESLSSAVVVNNIPNTTDTFV